VEDKVSDPDPYEPIGSGFNQVRESGFVSRRAKMTHKNVEEKL
jgi:hypothetical protein